MWFVLCSLFVLAINFQSTTSLPNGSPLGACESLSPEAGHGGHSQNVADAPFSVVATTNKYSAGDKIGGKLLKEDNFFKFWLLFF